MKTRWEKILDLDFYTEGPALDREGNLYFSTLSGGSILRLDIHRNLFDWSRMASPNGHRILENGQHLVCDTRGEAVVRLDHKGQIIGRCVALPDQGLEFTSPNDLAIDSGGGFYFTDSVRNEGQVFYVSSDGGLKLVLKDLDVPNGIVVSPEGSRLYIAETRTNRILVAGLSGPGEVTGQPEVFADLPRNSLPEDSEKLAFTANLPDGIALDQKGRLWVAHYGMGALQVLGPDGNLLCTVPTGIPATSNLCFTADWSTIYVTGGYGEPGPGCVHRIFIESD